MKKVFQMKNLKLLNKIYLLVVVFFSFVGLNLYAEEPIDIWNVEIKKIINDNKLEESIKEKNATQNSIYRMQADNEGMENIKEEENLTSKKIEIIGLYDPAENGLDINMWSNSNGDQILNIFKRINKMKLSEDASEILDILLLTNAHYPNINITEDQFLEIKSTFRRMLQKF